MAASSAPSIPSRSEVIARFRDGGGGVAAVFPIHSPRELFRAFDLLPVEVWGPPGVDTMEGDAHIQSYACSIVRCGLSFVLGGGLDIADVLVVPHACDSLQGLASVLLDFSKDTRPVLPLYIPRGERDSDVEFLAGELRDAYEKLAATTGRRPSHDDLRAAIRRETAADLALTELLLARPRLQMSNRTFYTLVRTREFLPAEDFVALAGDALQSAGADVTGIPILLSGIVPEPMDVLDVLDEADLTVVADDMACVGRRVYRSGQSDDPFMRMAERLLSGPPDATRSNIQARVDHLVARCRSSGARGAVFYTVKFCEPELFQHPLVTRGLQDAGIPTLIVEADIGDPVAGQLVTRLEAFAETLS